MSSRPQNTITSPPSPKKNHYSPKSDASHALTPIRYMADPAFVKAFYASILGHDLQEELRAMKEEELLLEQKARLEIWYS